MISKSLYESIQNFNNVIGNTYGDAYRDDNMYASYAEEKIQAQSKLIMSEFKELEDSTVNIVGDALNGKTPERADYDGARDGVADVVVTVVGLLHRLGISYIQYAMHGELWDCDWVYSRMKITNFGFEKLVLWGVPEVDIMREYCEKAINDAIRDEKGDKTITQITSILYKKLCRIIYWMEMVAKVLNTDLHEDLYAITENNLMKFRATEEQSKETIEMFAGAAVTVVATPAEGGLVVHTVTANDSEDQELQEEFPVGKCVKPAGFTTVDLPERSIPNVS